VTYSRTTLTNLDESDLDDLDHEHPYGSPLNLMWLSENHSVIVDYDSINSMFTHPEVADRKMVVFSIIGAFRKGKSFLMDYCLRFMYANVSVL
jgi:Guanylate-binding protein, N-terminal domain